jgi:hypothetical protein
VKDFSRVRSLRRFWTFLCCVVLRACGMKAISSLSFVFFARRNRLRRYARMHFSLARSRLPCKQQLERLLLCPPLPARFTYVQSILIRVVRSR